MANICDADSILSERMPVSQIDWPCDNSERRDINMDPFEDRFERIDTRATTPFYKDEMAYLQVIFPVLITSQSFDVLKLSVET